MNLLLQYQHILRALVSGAHPRPAKWALRVMLDKQSLVLLE